MQTVNLQQQRTAHATDLSEGRPGFKQF